MGSEFIWNEDMSIIAIALAKTGVMMAIYTQLRRMFLFIHTLKFKHT